MNENATLSLLLCFASYKGKTNLSDCCPNSRVTSFTGFGQWEALKEEESWRRGELECLSFPLTWHLQQGCVSSETFVVPKTRTPLSPPQCRAILLPALSAPGCLPIHGLFSHLFHISKQFSESNSFYLN